MSARTATVVLLELRKIEEQLMRTPYASRLHRLLRQRMATLKEELSTYQLREVA